MKTIPWYFLVASSLTACAAFADDTPASSTVTDPVARAAIEKGFEFRPPSAKIKASPSITATSVSLPGLKGAGATTGDLSDAFQATPVQMPAYQVRDLPDRTFRELNESVAVRDLLAPCVIFKKDTEHGQELQAIGAPIRPIEGEKADHALQARFPVVSLAW